MTVTQKTTEKALRFYKANGAPPLDADGMMSPPDIPAEVLTSLNIAPLVAGSKTTVLFKDDAAGMSLVYARFLAGYRLPRHSHSSDCLYYVVSGEAHMGGRVIETGDGFFVRSGQPYTYTAGPDGVEVLEFRGATSFDMKIFDRTVEKWAPIVQAAEDNQEDWRATWTAELSRTKSAAAPEDATGAPLGSPEWFELMSNTLTNLVKEKGKVGESFSFCEVWAAAPEATIGRTGEGRAAWHVRVTGDQCTISAGEVDDVTLKVVFDYAGTVRYARTRMQDATIPPAVLEVTGDPGSMPTYFGELHDLLAPQTA